MEVAKVNKNQTVVVTASKTSYNHLNVSNDDDQLTTILINDSSGQPVMGLTATIIDINNPSINYTAVSNSNGWVSLGEVVEGTYNLTVTDNGLVVSIGTVIVLSRNDFEVILTP